VKTDGTKGGGRIFQIKGGFSSRVVAMVNQRKSKQAPVPRCTGGKKSKQNARRATNDGEMGSIGHKARGGKKRALREHTAGFGKVAAVERAEGKKQRERARTSNDEPCLTEKKKQKLDMKLTKNGGPRTGVLPTLSRRSREGDIALVPACSKRLHKSRGLKSPRQRIKTNGWGHK